MADYILSCCSTADLSREHFAARDISYICFHYELDGKQIDYFPTTTELKRCKPIFEELPGWKCDIRGIKKFEDLPENARHYVEFAEKHLGVPVCMVSNGPAREDIMYR